MPKMMYRKDIEQKLKRIQKEALEIKNSKDDSIIKDLKLQFLLGYSEALKDVLG